MRTDPQIPALFGWPANTSEDEFTLVRFVVLKFVVMSSVAFEMCCLDCRGQQNAFSVRGGTITVKKGTRGVF